MAHDLVKYECLKVTKVRLDISYDQLRICQKCAVSDPSKRFLAKGLILPISKH